MKVLESSLEGPLYLEPAVLGDDRGFFCETYRESALRDLGVDESFVQHNHSRSGYGVIRGMHFHARDGVTKLVRCARGAIVDVLVDLRAGSSTYKQWAPYELSDSNMRTLFVPKGFGHGFCVTSEVADVLCLQSGYCDAEVERGVSYADPELKQGMSNRNPE